MDDLLSYVSSIGPLIGTKPLPGSDQTIGVAPAGTIATIAGVRVKLLSDVKVEAGPNFNLFSDGKIQCIHEHQTISMTNNIVTERKCRLCGESLALSDTTARHE